jgi:Holliday junction DNA helicase RuvB
MYTNEELARIITRSAGILDIAITHEGALTLARCSRGTPRVANRLLRRARDFAQVSGNGIIDEEIANDALKRMDIDFLGLDAMDRNVMRAIMTMYQGGPVGLETLAATIGEESVTIEDVCEPYLMQLGFLSRTPKGRIVTQLAYDHMGIKNPKVDQTVYQQTLRDIERDE